MDNKKRNAKVRQYSWFMQFPLGRDQDGALGVKCPSGFQRLAPVREEPNLSVPTGRPPAEKYQNASQSMLELRALSAVVVFSRSCGDYKSYLEHCQVRLATVTSLTCKML